VARNEVHNSHANSKIFFMWLGIFGYGNVINQILVKPHGKKSPSIRVSIEWNIPFKTG
jgi:hypothetical protein